MNCVRIINKTHKCRRCGRHLRGIVKFKPPSLNHRRFVFGLSFCHNPVQLTGSNP
jgi:hypothetical protein